MYPQREMCQLHFGSLVQSTSFRPDLELVVTDPRNLSMASLPFHRADPKIQNQVVKVWERGRVDLSLKRIVQSMHEEMKTYNFLLPCSNDILCYLVNFITMVSELSTPICIVEDYIWEKP